MHIYYNRPDVREAMHAAPIQSEAGIFLDLNPRIQLNYNYNILSVVPQHQFLLERGALMHLHVHRHPPALAIPQADIA